MPSHVTAEPGSYNIWAHSTGETPSAVTITATAQDGTVLGRAHWTTRPADVPGLPRGPRATAAQFHDVPVGATITTRPDTARLIILRADSLAPVYDSDAADEPT